MTDDGTGGVDPHGGGLSGLRRRVRTVDGRLDIASPPGGPTRVDRRAAPARMRPGRGTAGRAVVIAEDAAVMREGLVRLLDDHGHDVCAAVADGDALLAAVAAHRPDVAVVDIRMPPTHTDEGLRAALDPPPRPPGHRRAGVLPVHRDQLRGSAARGGRRRYGGVGYLLKDRVADVADFIDAVTRVATGGTALDPDVVSHLLGTGSRADGLTQLTPREREVLALMAEGRSNAGIAAALTVSAGAVEKHVAGIFDKFGLPPAEGDNRRVLAVLRHLRS